MFIASSLKPRTGIYLKSAEELQVDGQWPFLEIGINKAECHHAQRWACPSQAEKGPLVRWTPEGPSGLLMLSARLLKSAQRGGCSSFSHRPHFLGTLHVCSHPKQTRALFSCVSLPTDPSLALCPHLTTLHCLLVAWLLLGFRILITERKNSERPQKIESQPLFIKEKKGSGELIAPFIYSPTYFPK